MGVLILVVLLLLILNPQILPGLGSLLGARSRRPYRQAKWVWNSLAGTEDSAIRAEGDYGEACARIFEQQFSGSAPHRDQAMVEDIGAKLAAAVNDPRRTFRFTAVASPAANAYALPGGFIFITQPLLDLCGRNRDETALFLAHEIGHVKRGHAKNLMAANAFFHAVASRMPAAGRMLREVAGKGYSRSLELEADAEAARLTAAAGFDASAAISALGRLRQVAPDLNGLAEYLSSHPPVQERIDALKAAG